MRAFRRFFLRLSASLSRQRDETRLRDEIEQHLALQTAENMRAGLSPTEARRQAVLKFGAVEALKEDYRDRQRLPFLEQLFHDIRYALRGLRKNPGFTAVAVITLALGIGANTAIYSFLDAILIRPLPVFDPDSLVVLNWQSRDPRVPGQDWRPFVMHSINGRTYTDSAGMTAGIFPFPAFELFQESGLVFSSVFAFYPAGNLNILVGGHAEVGSGEYVSGHYFRGLMVVPAAGRLFVDDDDRVGALPVAVVSFAFGRKNFGESERAVGHPIVINDTTFTIVGVVPPEFLGTDPAAAPDVYLPMRANLLLTATTRDAVSPQAYRDQNYYWIEIMGRLRPGVSASHAQVVLAPMFQQWVAATASQEERTNLPRLLIREGAGGTDTLRHQYSKPLSALLTMVGLILAIACFNIANLLLARSATRRREIAVRLSMGASRLRLVRQLLTESLLLSSLGGAVGVLIAIWGIHALTLLLANGQENFVLHPDVNWRVLGQAAIVSLLCGGLFGLGPAIQSTNDIVPALKESRASTQAKRGRGRAMPVNLTQTLIVVQIALSVLMLVAASLFVRTLSNLQAIDLGFNRDNLLLFDANAVQAGHRSPEAAMFYEDLRRRLETIPGVRSVSLSHASLISAGRQLPIDVSGTRARGTRILNIGPSFFTTMQIPMRRGRAITDRDRPGSQRVVVVSELFAKTYFGDADPIGRHITLGGPKPSDLEIIGVAANARYGGLKAQNPAVVYIPYSQMEIPPLQQMTYVLRLNEEPLKYVSAVREIVHQADHRLPLANVKTQAAEVDQTMIQESVFAKVSSSFAILALMIVCVGLYGTVRCTVERRTMEIGIRMALGGHGGAVVWLMLRDVLILIAVGLAIAVPMALATSTFVESFLFGVKHDDLQVLTFVLVILMTAALLAGYLPARRAARVDPLVALKYE